MADPISVNLVASMDRPGSNVTGITSFDPQQASKQFELLKEAFPGIRRVAILSDKTIPGADERGLVPIDRANEAAARALGREPQIAKVQSAADLEAAIAAMIKEGGEALLVLEVPVPFTARKQVADLALKNRFAGNISWRPSGGGQLDYLWN